MNKHIILLFLITFSSQLFAAKVPKSWLGQNDISRSLLRDDLTDLEKNYQTLLQTQDDVFSKAVSGDNSKWYLQSIMTELAVEAEGELGILAGGGESALEFIWIRKAGQAVLNSKLNSQEIINEEDELPSLEIRSEMDENSLEQEIKPIAQLAMASGFVKNKKSLLSNLLKQAKEFQTTIKDIESSPIFGPWYVYKYQLELYISAEGKISLVDIGASLRLRMEWWRLQKKNAVKTISPYRPISLSPNAAFISNLGEDLQVLNQVKFDNGFHLNCMKIGIGKTVEGNLFLVKGKSKVAGSLFFKRDEIKPEHFIEPKLDYDDETYTIEENDESFDLKRPAFKQAIIKSSEILKFFANKAKLKKESLFELDVIEGEFELFTSGGVGLVTIEGSAGVTLFVTRNVTI